MKEKNHLFFLGIFWGVIFLTQGCYTQLAVSHRVYISEPAEYYSNQAESSQDTLFEEEKYQDTIVHEHYWADDPWFYYDPFYYDPWYHMSFSFTWGDPYWYPWYRPYWSRHWHSGWCWYDPYYNYAYYPGYYFGYYPGYGYPYGGWYWASYYTLDPTPKKKRNWDRRGGDLTDRTISHSSDSEIGKRSSSSGTTPTPMVKSKSGSSKGTRSVQRRNSGSSRNVTRGHQPSRRSGSKSIRSTRSRSNLSRGSIARTAKRAFYRSASGRSNSSVWKGVDRSISRSGSSKSVNRSSSRSSYSSSRQSSHRSFGSNRSGGSRQSSGGKSRR